MPLVAGIMGDEEIKAYLQSRRDEASLHHEREQRHETARAEQQAREHFERFVLHGMIRDDLAEGLE